jgi:uncharacterized protein with PIN domain
MDVRSAPLKTGYGCRFFADVMLGTLARWLRVLGYDTSYENTIDDDELIRRCIEEGRVALTRDRRLAQRRLLEECLFIESESLNEQLSEVLRFTQESVLPGLILSRCLECNSKIEKVEKAEVAAQVAPYVLKTQDEFSRCQKCGRVYWAGTHRERILERLRGLVGEVEFTVDRV